MTPRETFIQLGQRRDGSVVGIVVNPDASLDVAVWRYDPLDHQQPTANENADDDGDDGFDAPLMPPPMEFTLKTPTAPKAKGRPELSDSSPLVPPPWDFSAEELE